MPSLLFWLLVIAFVLAVLPSSAHAFGAGNLPSYGYLEDRAFRHGDIEDVLAELLKKTGSGLLKHGSKFKGLDIKRVYFGNWLRDYSQAVDVAGLKATSIQNIITICTVLGFLAHGYVTDEFEVTEERLGVYLPTEHIDNPKGYPEDARNYHPKLRGPVDPRELEVDLQTGMKNYIANEGGTWDTSKALIRRRLVECINLGRQYRANGNKHDQYEAFRLLGTALHTMEDFPAHSNFCELALVSMGHDQVFTHVGDYVRIQAPNGKTVAPLVTGTFGGDDFQHSLLGEAGDHISQSSISDLNEHRSKALTKSRGGGDVGSPNKIKSLLASLPTSDAQGLSRDVDQIQNAKATKDPNTMTPKEIYQNIWMILRFRDSIVKKISYGIEKIPGLGPLIDAIMENLTVFVFQMLEPYLKPLMQTATKQLAASSASVIDSVDQYQVFNDPQASDPTHSMLSKDHFNLILNEPAGNLAKIIVIHTVKLVVHAWDNVGDDVHNVTETVLQCLFHPEFHNQQSQVQREMLQFMRDWIRKHSAGTWGVLGRLTKDAIRNHENVRKSGDTSAPPVSTQTHGHGAAVSYGHEANAKIQSTVMGIPGVSQVHHGYQQFQSFTNKMPSMPGREMGAPGGTMPGGTEHSSGPGNDDYLPVGAHTTIGSGPPGPSGMHSPPPGAPPASPPMQNYGSPPTGPPSFPGGSSFPGGPSFPGQSPGSNYGAPSGPPPSGYPSPGGYGSPGPGFPGGPPGGYSQMPPSGPYGSPMPPSGPSPYGSPPMPGQGNYGAPPPNFPGGPPPGPGFPGGPPNFPGGPPSGYQQPPYGGGPPYGYPGSGY